MNKKPTIGIMYCLHGNEMLGYEVVKLLKEVSLPNVILFFILGNEEAMKQNKRFIDSDLNRCFPGDENGNYEEKRAACLMKQLADCDYVIDIHSTTAKTESFVICTKEDELTRKLACSVPLNKLVVMQNTIASGKSLIDHVKSGISIEFNLNTSIQEAANIVIECVSNLVDEKMIEKDTYFVYGTVNYASTRTLFTNFEKTIFEGELFYPILFGEKEYTNIVCLKAKRND